MCWACLQSEHYGSLDGASADPPAAMSYVSTYRALLAYSDGRPNARWNNEMATGTPVIVTYSFTESRDLPRRFFTDPISSSYSSFSAQQRADFRAAAAVLQKTAGIVLVEKTGAAMVNVFSAQGTEQWAGWAHYPQSTGNSTFAGDLVISTDDGANFAPGTYAFMAILHELGHAVGLKHPFEGDTRLVDSLDVKSQTLMSYDYRGRNYTAYSPLDVQALQHLYGTPADTGGWSWGYSGQVLVLKGGAKADVILGVRGGNDLDGRSGDDRLIGRESADILRGGYGDDWLAGRGGADELWGGPGNDTLYGGMDSNATFNDWPGNKLNGGAGNDSLFGQNSEDTLSGGSGHDSLEGRDGDDLLIGGLGADTLLGGHGVDTLRGDGGKDLLIGDMENSYYTPDLLKGGAGNDTLRSQHGNDTLRGGGGDDRIEVLGSSQAVAKGESGADVFVIQSTGSATLSGGDGNDRIEMTGGSAVANGDGGDDVFVIRGGGSATLNGGSGDDRVDLMNGHAEAKGGSGADVFVIRSTGAATLSGGMDDDTFYLRGTGHMLLVDAAHDRGIDRIHSFDTATDSITLTDADSFSFYRYGGDKLKLIAGVAELRFADLSYADRDNLMIYI